MWNSSSIRHSIENSKLDAYKLKKNVIYRTGQNSGNSNNIIIKYYV